MDGPRLGRVYDSSLIEVYLTAGGRSMCLLRKEEAVSTQVPTASSDRLLCYIYAAFLRPI